MNEMKEMETKLTLEDKEYILAFNLNAMSEIQEKYGTINNWVKEINLDGSEGEEPNLKALIYGLTVMLNEGIEITNDRTGSKDKLFTQKEVGRLLSKVGMEEASQKMADAVIESTKSDEKN